MFQNIHQNYQFSNTPKLSKWQPTSRKPRGVSMLLLLQKFNRQICANAATVTFSRRDLLEHVHHIPLPLRLSRCLASLLSSTRGAQKRGLLIATLLQQTVRVVASCNFSNSFAPEVLCDIWRQCWWCNCLSAGAAGGGGTFSKKKPVAFYCCVLLLWQFDLICKWISRPCRIAIYVHQLSLDDLPLCLRSADRWLYWKI